MVQAVVDLLADRLAAEADAGRKVTQPQPLPQDRLTRRRGRRGPQGQPDGSSARFCCLSLQQAAEAGRSLGRSQGRRRGLMASATLTRRTGAGADRSP